MQALPLALYFCVNALFVAKYGARISTAWVWLVPAYAAVLFLGIKGIAIAASRLKSLRGVYWTLFCICFLAFGCIQWRIDPYHLQVDRFSAITAFNHELLAGRFPYLARTHLGQQVSGFPGLFLLLLPFQLLGSVGLFELFSFALIALIIDRTRLAPAQKLVLLFLVCTSPAFAWEVAARSELFGNMVLAAAFLLLAEKYRQPGTLRASLGLGALAGLLLSTRGIVLIPLLLYFPCRLLERPFRHGAVFAAAACCSVGLLFLPFYFWNPTAFALNNPFLLQSGYIPAPLLGFVLLISLAAGFRESVRIGVQRAAGIALFSIVGVVFVLDGWRAGFNKALFESAFDVSYFIFCLPFIIFAVYRNEEGSQGAVSAALAESAGEPGSMRS